MQLVPVLEIRHGKGVHTEPKNPFADQVVKEDIQSTVSAWVDQGIQRLHIVDVDAIESGEPQNIDQIHKIKSRHPDLELQVIGGINQIESAFIWVDAGADFLVLSGKSIRNQDLVDDICVNFPNRVLVEVDCHEGKVGVLGTAPSSLSAMAQKLEADGVSGMVVTQVKVNGSVSEQCFSQLGETTKSLSIPVFANGLVEKLADLEQILSSGDNQPSGILIGKTLFNGGFDLSQAHTLLKQHSA